MAAQKLTKARLAQILIMLSLLVIAFFWRTFTYETNSTVDCSQKQRCDVTIGTEKVVITKRTDGFSLELKENSSIKIDLNQGGNFLEVDDKYLNVEWNRISEDKVIRFKLNQNNVEVYL